MKKFVYTGFPPNQLILECKRTVTEFPPHEKVGTEDRRRIVRRTRKQTKENGYILSANDRLLRPTQWLRILVK